MNIHRKIFVCFLIAILYFLLIIPVQSQETPENPEPIQTPNSITTGENQIPISGESSSGSLPKAELQTFFSGPIQTLSTGENLSGNNFQPDTTGEIIAENHKPQLIISELYYDGTEEWIEITNLGEDFSGVIQITTPQSYFGPMTIAKHQSLMLTKPGLLYTWISPLVSKLPRASFGFTDTKAIHVSLLRDSQLLDIFQAETGLVVKYNDKKTSLTKYFNNQLRTLSGCQSPINVLDPYIASPGFFEYTRETPPPESDPPASGSDLGGGSMSGIVEPSIPSSPQSSPLSITEIYLGNGQFSSFIELKAQQDFSGKVVLSGSLLKTPLVLETFLEKNEYQIIVYIDNHRLSDQKKTVEHSLYLKSSGFLELIGQSGQVFDIIQVLSMSGDKSVYYSGFSNGNIDIFSKIDSFSPGFDEKFLGYFPYPNPATTGQTTPIQPTPPQSNSGALSISGSETGQNLSGSTSFGSLLQPKDLQIEDVHHTNPESITIGSNISGFVDLSSKDFYLLTRENQSSGWKTTKKYLTGILLPQNYITIFKTWGFLDKGSCVGLFYQTILLDEFCYQETPPPEKKEDPILSETGIQEESVPDISIQGLLPNPAGSDSKEQIILFWSTDTTSGSTQGVFSKTLYLKNKSTKKYINKPLDPNTGTLLIGSRGLTNKATCITLRYKDTQLDEFCYPNPKEDEYFFTSNIALQMTQKPDLTILQNVGFIVTGSKICISYHDQMLTCRQLPASKTSIKLKNENKLYKTYVGLLQSYLMKNRSPLYYNTHIKTYFDTLKNSKSQISKASSITLSGQQFDLYDLSGQIDLQTKLQGLSGNHIQAPYSFREKILKWLGL